MPNTPTTTTAPMTHMHREALQASDMLKGQLANIKHTAALVDAIKALNPNTFITVARGSSDHAAHFFAYLVMQKLGILTVSLPPSLVTLHHAPLKVSSSVAFGFSQSGASPDLVDTLSQLDERGAQTIACVNQAHSALEQVADLSWPIDAGSELSVAATKSCLGIMTLATQFVALWRDDQDLIDELHALTEQFAHPTQHTPSRVLDVFGVAKRVFVIGRGLSHSVALEAALKMKETCAIQSEAFSVAEVRHGPMRLIEANYPVIIFVTSGSEQAQLVDFSIEMRARGAHVLAICVTDAAVLDRLVRAGVMVVDACEGRSPFSPTLAPLVALQSFYVFVSQLALHRGMDPDRPLYLNKVTQTH